MSSSWLSLPCHVDDRRLRTRDSHIRWDPLRLLMVINSEVSCLRISDSRAARSWHPPWPFGSLLGYTHARGWERKIFPTDEMAADILTSTFGRPLTSQGHRSDSWLSHFPSSQKKRLMVLMDTFSLWLQPGKGTMSPQCGFWEDFPTSPWCTYQQPAPHTPCTLDLAPLLSSRLPWFLSVTLCPHSCVLLSVPATPGIGDLYQPPYHP